MSREIWVLGEIYTKNCQEKQNIPVEWMGGFGMSDGFSGALASTHAHYWSRPHFPCTKWSFDANLCLPLSQITCHQQMSSWNVSNLMPQKFELTNGSANNFFSIELGTLESQTFFIIKIPASCKPEHSEDLYYLFRVYWTKMCRRTLFNLLDHL